MCGILGKVSNSKIDKSNFNNDLSLLSHRGPDSHGTFFYDNIALGHTRLSIIDLSQCGHQPMEDQNDKYVIIYNGEIYNFKSIRDELISKGYSFKSKSDTEVILNGYIEFKEKIVNKLEGMFSLCILNKRNREVFLARDRMGIKPLYYYNDGKSFTFSSEIRPLKKYSSGLNAEAKILFLALGSVPEPVTIYNNIYSFPKGHFGFFKNGNLKISKYAQEKYLPKIKSNYQNIVFNTKNYLHKSIKNHLISDAPIGTFLSGGLDSSAITCIAAQYKKDLVTLSLDFNERNLSEKYYQDLIVKKYNTSHNRIIIDEKKFIDNIQNFISSMDQPTVDGLNSYFVSLAASESGLKAVLSGVGGDEIFYGYSTFRNAKKIEMLKYIPNYIIKILARRKRLKKLEYMEIKKDIFKYLSLRTVFTPSEIAQNLNCDLEYVKSIIVKNINEYKVNQLSLDDKTSLFELDMYMKNQLLRDTDVFGMAHSLEIRVPFLDKELVEYVLRIDPQLKFKNNINKSLLADSVKDLVPSEIIKRKKMGFELPFKYWFKNNINQFNIDKKIKDDFLNDKIHWSKVWALFISNNFK
tara:strand:+ start:3896 stop:5632 length:1737 start_codon:yes stop_codon:yes gene_type:complete